MDASTDCGNKWLHLSIKSFPYCSGPLLCCRLGNKPTEPGVRTTFKIHCGSYKGKKTVRFEILKKDNVRTSRHDNKPSGYFFYVDMHNSIWANDESSPTLENTNFALHWVGGTRFGVEVIYRGKWASPNQNTQYARMIRTSRTIQNQQPKTCSLLK